VLVIVLIVTLTPFESSVAHETSNAAKVAINKLPYHISVKEDPVNDDVIVGQVHGNLGESFDFYVIVGRSIPNNLKNAIGSSLEATSLSERYSFLSPIGESGRSAAQKADEINISLAVQEALCLQATDAPCSA
jgi:hypothetical protein